MNAQPALVAQPSRPRRLLLTRSLAALAVTVTTILVASTPASAMVPGPGAAGSSGAGSTVVAPSHALTTAATTSLQWFVVVAVGLAALAIGAALATVAQRSHMAHARPAAG